MRRLGIIGRADQGGLASQTLSVAENLGCAAALIPELGTRRRGDYDIKPWKKAADEVRVCSWPASREDAAWLLDRCDVVYTAECPLFIEGDAPTFQFPAMAAERHIEFVLHANPELFRKAYHGPTTTIALPTPWLRDRFAAPVLPMPVDRRKFRFTQRPSVTRHGHPIFLHLAAPAMLDRNGTSLTASALHHVRSQIALKTQGLRSATGPMGGGTPLVERERVGFVEVEHRAPRTSNLGIYNGADVLILPRRYGGLSMPMLEAASLGMPVITLNVPPQDDWFLPDQLVTILESNTQREQMIGGRHEVYDARPEALADVIDRFATEPELVARCSKLMDAWAEQNSWDALRVHWIKTLGL